MVIPQEQLCSSLEDLEAFVTRFVWFRQEAQATAVALWVAHTHAIEAAEATPYLAITSPEKGSGKTRLLEVLEMVVRRPWRSANTSVAALFRKVSNDCPTLLMDELDTIFKSSGDTAQALRGILNAGNRRGQTVTRVEGDSMKVVDYVVFGPKALTGLGYLPDTLADRSIAIRMVRQAVGERVERFRHRRAAEDARSAQDAISAWGDEDIVSRLARSEPDIPEGLSDRQADAWEPLLAIADLAGGLWPERARRAAVELNGDLPEAKESQGVRLLTDIGLVFGALEVDRLATEELLVQLVEGQIADVSGPWGEMWGNEMAIRGEGGVRARIAGPASQLARLLREYGFQPRSVRTGAKVQKGYVRSDFSDAWARYSVANDEVARQTVDKNSRGPYPKEAGDECSHEGCPRRQVGVPSISTTEPVSTVTAVTTSSDGSELISAPGSGFFGVPIEPGGFWRRNDSNFERDEDQNDDWFNEDGSWRG